MQKFDTPAPISAVLDIPAGTRPVHRRRPGRHHGRGPAGRRLEEPRREGGGADQGRVRRRRPADRGAPAKNQILGNSGSVEVTVQLPAGSRVEAKAASRRVPRRRTARRRRLRGRAGLGQARRDRRAPASPSTPATSRSAAWAVPRRSAPRRATSASPRPLPARSCCAPSRRRLGRRRPRGLRLPGRRHLLRPDPERAQNTDGAAASLNIRATTAYGDITARSL